MRHLHCSHSAPSSRWHKLYSNKHFSPVPTNLHDTFLRDARKCKLCVMNVPPAYTWQYSVGCSNSVAQATMIIPVQRSCESLQSCNCNLSMKQFPCAVSNATQFSTDVLCLSVINHTNTLNKAVPSFYRTVALALLHFNYLVSFTGWFGYNLIYYVSLISNTCNSMNKNVNTWN